MIFEIYRRLYEIALKEFSDIVVKGEILRLPSGAPLKLRLYLLDDSLYEFPRKNTLITRKEVM